MPERMAENAAPIPAPAAASHAVVGWTLALSSTLAFSLATPVAKVAYRFGLDPTVMLMLRILITVALFLAMRAVVPARRRPLDRRGMAIALAAGAIHGTGTLSFYWALTAMDASISSMIFALYPLAVLLLLALRGERFTYRNLVRLALGLGGVYLLIGPGGQVSVLGVALVGVSVLASATQTVISQSYLQAYDPQTVLLFLMTGMGTLMTGYWLFTGAALADLALSPGAWVAVGVLAALCTFFAWVAWFAAMRRVGTGPVAMLVPLETFLTVIWSVLFLSERLTPVQWLGGVLILFSTLLAVRRLGRVRLWPWRPAPPTV
jgi:drug/metabolite transporter (DMT)-like permease